MRNPLRRPRLVAATPDAPPIPDTPLAAALRALLADGVDAAVARIERDPAVLPGLAREIIAQRRSTAAALWEAAAPIAHAPKFVAAMDTAGLGWCAGRIGRAAGGIGPRDAGEPFRVAFDYPHPNGGQFPAAVAPIVTAWGEMLGCAILFFKADWTGLLDRPRAVVTVGEVAGGFVALHTPRDRIVASVTFAAASRAFAQARWPARVCLTGHNLAHHFMPPPGVRHVILAYDTASEREAARIAGSRLRAAACEVELLARGERVERFNDDEHEIGAVSELMSADAAL
jgi:hypothetical protein